MSNPEFVCEICGKSFVNAKGLAGHMRLSHQKPTKQDGYALYASEAAAKQQESIEQALAKHEESTKAYVNDALEKLESAWEAHFKDRLEELESQQEDAWEALTKGLEHLTKGLEYQVQLHKKLETVGKLIESVGNGVIMTNNAAEWCLGRHQRLKSAGGGTETLHTGACQERVIKKGS